jgi:hypothetical protein
LPTTRNPADDGVGPGPGVDVGGLRIDLRCTTAVGGEVAAACPWRLTAMTVTRIL